ncbi:MAG TPA: DUF222 domain-containing protein, partial [Jatrophihabitantaceae bacterium]|nr:DUF222 domain-containing protein [Jatrophihabitantaceae bacterium]
ADTDEQLLGLELAALSRDELLQLQRDEEAHVRRHAVIGHRLIAELTSRGVAFELGAKTTAGLLVQLLRISPGEAGARVLAAGRFGTRRSLTGAVLPPVFAATAAAQAAGMISPGHARLIADTVLALPAAVAAEHDLAVEATLLEHAATFSPNVLAGLAKRIRDTLDPDGSKPREEDHTRLRGLTLSTRLDGSGFLTGYLTPECLAITRAWLDSLAAPAPPEDGTRDPRAPAQRMHDALHAAGTRLLAAADTLPPCGGTPTTLLVTVTADQLATHTCSGGGSGGSGGGSGGGSDGSDRSSGSGGSGSGDGSAYGGTGGGYAVTAHGDLIPVATAMRLADQADIVTVRLDSRGAITSYGRQRRTASTNQRLALAARDRGCTFPGCTAPPGWTQAHHVRAWQDGGTTDLDNLTLVCGHHHRNFERLGWTCHMSNGTPTGDRHSGSTQNENPVAIGCIFLSCPPTPTDHSDASDQPPRRHPHHSADHRVPEWSYRHGA